MTTQVSSAEITDEVEMAEADWSYPIVKYLRDPSGNHERTTRFRAWCYLIYHNELYQKGSDGLLLPCPSAEDIKPTILNNCIEYAKGCIKCQIYGPIQRVPAEPLHPVTKPWPFRGWAVDIIGKIHPTASNQHAWILSNGQAEASNKVIKAILEKMIEEKPWAWHDLLPEALWAYGVSKRSAIGASPYALTYGHDTIVPMELKVRSLRVTERPGQEEKDYAQAMAQELEDLEQSRLDAHNLMQAQKQMAARAYNRKVKQKTFAKGDLAWRVVLPIGTKDPRLCKFSPNWEGPFIIEQILGRGAFQLRDRDEEWHNLPINGQYLKKFTPSLWEMAKNGL
ncbi:unnamed protein product [Prunus brigantina]